jgi:CrcB protein
MTNVLLVGAGGFIGAVLRYKLGGVVLHHTVNWKFPMSTFAVNVAGCLVAGVLMGLAVKHECFSQQTRLLLFTGILGGFTTFSAFGVETVTLLQDREFLWAGAYVLATVLAGILSLWLALVATR